MFFKLSWQRNTPNSTKKVLFHIGTGKTGSSSVQKTLRKGAKLLHKSGVAYPKYGHPTNHEELRVVFKGGAGLRAIKGRFIGVDETLIDYQSRLLQQFESELMSKKDLIYSAEHLYFLDATHLKSLKALLRKHGVDQVKVLLYFREPVSYYASQVQQRLRGASKVLNPNEYRPKYCDILARWQAEFDDVEVRDFTRSELVNGDVVDDFLSVSAEFFSAPTLKLLPKEKPVNESLMLEMMVLLQAYRRHCCTDKEGEFTPGTKRLIKQMQDLDFDYTKPELRPEVIQVLRANNRGSVMRLRKILGYELFRASFPEEDVSTKAPHDLVAVDVADIFLTPPDFHQRMATLSGQLLNAETCRASSCS